VVTAERIAGSPVAVAGIIVSAMMLWTCGYESTALHADVQSAPESTSGAETVEAASDEPAPEPEDRESQSAEPEPEPDPPVYGVRLRRPAVEGQLGQPIAIEGSPQVMSRFYAALGRAEAGEGQARILFYGASHVASDSFTGWVRGQLQARFGDAGHGFVLPAHPWRSYRHRGVEIESERSLWSAQRVRDRHTHGGAYGLAGVAVDAEEEGAWARVRTETRRDFGRNVSRFEVFYWRQAGGGSFDVLIDGVRRERLSTALPEGTEESATAYAVYDVEDGPHQLEIRARGDGPIRIFGVSLDRDVPGVRLDTLGINGSRARFHLLWNDEVYREHMARREADLVVLAYGTNEAGDQLPIPAYADQLRQVIGRVQEVAPQADCLLVGPTDRPHRENRRSPYVDRPRTLEVSNTQRLVSEEMGCGYFDLLAFMGGPLSMVDWASASPPHGARDHIHLTRFGYQRLAEEFFAALLEGYGEPSSAAAAGGGDSASGAASEVASGSR